MIWLLKFLRFIIKKISKKISVYDRLLIVETKLNSYDTIEKLKERVAIIEKELDIIWQLWDQMPNGRRKKNIPVNLNRRLIKKII